MRYRNKALIYEVDDNRISLDEGFDGYLERNDYIIIDTHTLSEEIIDDLCDKFNDIDINEIYKNIDILTNEIKEKIAENAIDYICRNYPKKYHE